MPPMLTEIAGTLFLAALVLFVMYRRFRRSFGQQPLRPQRMIFRIVVLTLIAALLLPGALLSATLAASLAGGLGVGVVLAVWGIRHTRFEKRDGTLFYLPHTYTGLIVFAVFLGRFLYDLLVFYPSLKANVMQSGGMPPGTLGALPERPPTVAIFFVLVGYYVCYYAAILWKSRHLRREDMEPPTAAG